MHLKLRSTRYMILCDTSLTICKYCHPSTQPGITVIFGIRHKAPSVRTTLLCPGHLLTPLFATVSYPKSGWHQFFFPSVAPVDVVKSIIQALDDQHSKTIMLPLYSHLMPYRQHLPSYLKDFAQWVSNHESGDNHPI